MLRGQCKPIRTDTWARERKAVPWEQRAEQNSEREASCKLLRAGSLEPEKQGVFSLCAHAVSGDSKRGKSSIEEKIPPRASARSRRGVRRAKPKAVMPAALAASTPRGLSSMMAQRAGVTPRRRAACKN